MKRKREETIRVLVKRPGAVPEMQNIPNTLEAMQGIVGGHIENVQLFSDLSCVCDEEGRLKGYPPCCTICGVDFVGTVLLVGTDQRRSEYCSVPFDEERARVLFPWMWVA